MRQRHPLQRRCQRPGASRRCRCPLLPQAGRWPACPPAADRAADEPAGRRPCPRYAMRGDHAGHALRRPRRSWSMTAALRPTRDRYGRPEHGARCRRRAGDARRRGRRRRGFASDNSSRALDQARRRRRTRLSQGTLIPAVLETAIDTDVPGYVRAVVSQDVRSFDGSRVLIPRSSRLIGEYKGATQAGQRRAYLMWTRLVRPDGVSVALASPAADFSGQAGIGGQVNSHFFSRFGSAILLSILGGAEHARQRRRVDGHRRRAGRARPRSRLSMTAIVRRPSRSARASRSACSPRAT